MTAGAAPTVVAFANQSGGAGKTTSTTAVAAILAQAGQRVLVVDGDGQCDTSHLLGHSDPDGAGRANVNDLLAGDTAVADAVTAALAGGNPDQAIGGLFVVPGSTELAAAERNLAGQIGAELTLRHALASVAGYDAVLIDCPASLGLVMVNILVAADYVVACVKPGLKELRALAGLEDTMGRVRAAYRLDGPELAGVLVCDTPAAGNLYAEALALARGQWGRLVLPPVPRTVRVAEAYAHQTPLPLFDPRSPATAAYRAVAGELAARGAVALAG